MNVVRPRRLGSVVGGLAVGVVGALALTTPTMGQASAEPSDPVDNTAYTLNVCAGTYVRIVTGSASEGPQGWQISVDGERVWPEEGDTEPLPGEWELVLVPPGEVTVGYEAKPELLTHTWQEPAFCAGLPEPAAVQPTCDEPGWIDIPALPVPDPLSLTGDTAAAATAPASELAYRLDGVEVDPESTHAVEAGTHVVVLQERLGDVGIDLVLQAWVFEIEEPDCPAEGGDSGDSGEGGELPKTGVPAGLVAGAAAALMVLGGGLYLLARRRRTTFTA